MRKNNHIKKKTQLKKKLLYGVGISLFGLSVPLFATGIIIGTSIITSTIFYVLLPACWIASIGCIVGSIFIHDNYTIDNKPLNINPEEYISNKDNTKQIIKAEENVKVDLNKKIMKQINSMDESETRYK